MPYYRCPACGLTTYSAASHSSASACWASLEALALLVTNWLRNAGLSREAATVAL
jgi:hypothetical protein